MHNNLRFAGRVRIWIDDGKWKWCPEDEAAPRGSKLADRYLGDAVDLIYVKHGDHQGEYIRGAVKA